MRRAPARPLGVLSAPGQTDASGPAHLAARCAIAVSLGATTQQTKLQLCQMNQG